MGDHDYQVQIQKDGNLIVVNPASGIQVAAVPFAGQISKGCSPSASVTHSMGHSTSTGNIRAFDTLFSFGHFSSSTIPGVMSMQQNPMYQDRGFEIEEIPGQEYPRLQYWSMYAILTADLSSLGAKFSRFQVANREENPVRLTTKLNRPWGEEPLKYELLDDEIPLYPWDAQAFEFATICPFTGGPATPIAFIRKDGDRTEMNAAWVRQKGVLTRTL